MRTITKNLNKEIFSVFDYSLFTTMDDGRLAYNYANRLDANVCNYCNTQYTFTIKSKWGKTRPQFDHFYHKSKHPYFAVSFFNLLPSCYVCNANLKKSQEFKFSTHIHPFIEGIEDLYEFSTKVNSIDYLLGRSGFDIRIRPVKGKHAPNRAKAKKNIDAFLIEKQYQFHKDYAGEIIKKAYVYSESKLDELLKDFEISPGVKLFNSKEEIIELVFGNYIDETLLHKRTLSKLTRDIIKELGIVK